MKNLLTLLLCLLSVGLLAQTGTPRDITYLESRFETGDKPSEADFEDVFASFLHYLQVQQSTGSSTSDVMSQNAITTALNTKQNTTTALTNLLAVSGTGLLVKTGADTWVTRSVTAGNGISVTNGSGVSGNPSYSWGNNDGGTSGNITDYTYIDPTDAGIIDLYFGSIRRFLGVYFYSSGVVSMNLNSGISSAQNTFSSNSFELQAGGQYPGVIHYNGTTGILNLQFDSLLVNSGKFFLSGVGTASRFNWGVRSSAPSALIHNGDAYYNSTSNRFQGRQNGAWVNFAMSGSIVNADISGSAAIAASKIADGSVSSTEFQYLANVTSDIQTQINTNVVDRVTAGTGGSTIDLDMTGKRQRIFAGSASFSTAKNLTISNETSNTIAFAFTFEITDLAAVLTMETNVLMQDSRFDGDDWTATATGVYKMTGTYDGTNWLCEISANPYQ